MLQSFLYGDPDKKDAKMPFWRVINFECDDDFETWRATCPCGEKLIGIGGEDADEVARQHVKEKHPTRLPIIKFEGHLPWYPPHITFHKQFPEK